MDVPIWTVYTSHRQLRCLPARQGAPYVDLLRRPGLIDSNTGTILSSTTFGWENIPCGSS
jgi:hypothetical protein